MKITAGKYALTLMIVMAMLYGCNPNVVPLKGNYSNNPVEITSAKPVDSIWSTITDIFATNGLPVKSINRQTGIIITKKIPFNSMYTFEDDNSVLQQPQAWVVISKIFNKKKQWKPAEIFSQWTVQITESPKGTATIKIDPVVICTWFPNSFTTMETREQSTGKFEQLLKHALKSE